MKLDWNELPAMLANFGIKLGIALIIYIVGNWIAKAIAKVVNNLMLKRKADKTIASFVSNIMYAVMLLVVVLAALSQLGVNTSSFMVIVGAAVLAVGMALQGTLGQFASGVMLIGMRPFKIGDSVIAGGQAGTVDDIGILNTIILTSDNKKIIVPNSAITGGAITNFSAMPTRKVGLAITVPGATDLNQGRDILKGIMQAETRILKDPAPSISIADANAKDITYGIGAHVNNADMSAVQASLLENIKKALTEAGIWA